MARDMARDKKTQTTKRPKRRRTPREIAAEDYEPLTTLQRRKALRHFIYLAGCLEIAGEREKSPRHHKKITPEVTPIDTGSMDRIHPILTPSLWLQDRQKVRIESMSDEKKELARLREATRRRHEEYDKVNLMMLRFSHSLLRDLREHNQKPERDTTMVLHQALTEIYREFRWNEEMTRDDLRERIVTLLRETDIDLPEYALEELVINRDEFKKRGGRFKKGPADAAKQLLDLVTGFSSDSIQQWSKDDHMVSPVKEAFGQHLSRRGQIKYILRLYGVPEQDINNLLHSLFLQEKCHDPPP